jgi:hypothetical protein
VVLHGRNSEIPARHERHDDLYWFEPLESKTLRPVWGWNYVSHLPRGGSRRRRSLEGHPRPPYIGWRALGYKLLSIYPIVGYNMEGLSELDWLVLYTKLSSCLWAHMSGRAGSTNRSADLLVGQARLTGTTETMVGGDPGVPMSLKSSIDV